MSLPGEYVAAVSALKHLGYSYQQTDHGMQWIKTAQLSEET